MSTQPNRKQQRLARETSKSDGVPYQTALAKIRAVAQQRAKDADMIVSPQRRMLELMYETFAVRGGWPLFQYVSAHWDEADVEARDAYLDLAEQGLVRPAMTRTHEFQLRQETVVGVSLQGLMDIGAATEDIDRFVTVVRYVAKSAREFRPSSPTELERLSVTSDEIRLRLGLEPGDTALARLGTLIADEAWQLWTSFGRTESDDWSFEVNLERARRYRDIETVTEFLDISYPKQQQQDAPLSSAIPNTQQSDHPRPHGNGVVDTIDLFISHASEDKDTVARPMSKALKARGWSVWLDELELTIGDSLSGGIDAALVRSRFGVVVLSPSYFAKQWPKRELAGLAAREVDAGSKVILPVWHEVDRSYVAQHSPILADRLGALTSTGIDDVADKISLALERAGVRAATGQPPEPVVQAVEPDDSASLLMIPTTTDGLAWLVDERRDWWEFLLYAGLLVRGKRGLEAKWDDHELHLPRGPRREFDLASANDFFSRELGWIQKHIVLDRIISPSIYEQAFGAPGQPGDVTKIEGMARRLLSMYESLLDWAAGLRNASVPAVYEEVLETTACLIDGPVLSVREFIDHVAHQTARLPELSGDGTDEHPITLTFELKLEIEDEVVERNSRAWEKLRSELG